MRCIIVDDEPLARKGIEKFAAELPFLQVVASCNNSLEAMTVIKGQQIDLMFLDIQMPRMTGIDFLKTLQQIPITIIISAFPDYALISYELDVIDYLVKPISLERFVKAVSKAKDYYDLKQSHVKEITDHVFIKCEHKYEKIMLNEIEFIEASGNYVTIYLQTRKYITYLTIKSVEESLPANDFIRINKSHIISRSRVSSISGNEVKVGNRSFIISRANREQVMEKIFGNNLLHRR